MSTLTKTERKARWKALEKEIAATKSEMSPEFDSAIQRLADEIVADYNRLKEQYGDAFDEWMEENTWTEDDEYEMSNDMEPGMVRLRDFLLDSGRGYSFYSHNYPCFVEKDEEDDPLEMILRNRAAGIMLAINYHAGDMTEANLDDMLFYVTEYDAWHDSDEEDRAIGILICSSNGKTEVAYLFPNRDDIMHGTVYRGSKDLPEWCRSYLPPDEIISWLVGSSKN